MGMGGMDRYGTDRKSGVMVGPQQKLAMLTFFVFVIIACLTPLQ